MAQERTPDRSPRRVVRSASAQFKAGVRAEDRVEASEARRAVLSCAECCWAGTRTALLAQLRKPETSFLVQVASLTKLLH